MKLLDKVEKASFPKRRIIESCLPEVLVQEAVDGDTAGSVFGTISEGTPMN